LFAGGLLALVLTASAPAGTVAYWRFEDSSTPGVVPDATGVNPGTLKNGASYAEAASNPANTRGLGSTQALKINRAPNQYQLVPFNASLSFGNNPWTAEAFVYLDTIPTRADTGFWLLHKKDGGSDKMGDYGLMIAGNRGATGDVAAGKLAGLSGRELQVEFGNNGTNASFTSHLEVPSTSQWVFLSAAYDGDKTVRFTLDTDLTDDLPGQIDTVVADFALTPVANLGPLFVGAKQSGTGTPTQSFNGRIDELRISSGVVPTSELLSSAPVPEPASAVLALCAAGGVTVLLRKRRRAP
jgi:Concanavalin A-like lectin/glucanases superfamily